MLPNQRIEGTILSKMKFELIFFKVHVAQTSVELIKAENCCLKTNLKGLPS